MSQQAISSTNDGPAIIAVYMITMVVGLVVVYLRLHVRLWLTRNFGYDDVCILFAMLLTILGAAFITLQVNSGLGRHTQSFPEPELQVHKLTLWVYAYQIINIVSVNVVKVSVALFILRIRNDKKAKYIIWVIISIMTSVNIIAFIASAVQCIPPRKLWTPQIEGKCFYPEELDRIVYAQSVVSCITDAICTLAPVIILWNLRIDQFQKLGIYALMSIGLVATVCNVLRPAWISDLTDSDDVTYAIVGTVIAAFLENNLGIIAACVPILRPLFKSQAIKKHAVPNLDLAPTFRSPNYQTLLSDRSDPGFRDGSGLTVNWHSDTQTPGNGKGFSQELELGQIIVKRSFEITEGNRAPTFS